MPARAAPRNGTIDAAATAGECAPSADAERGEAIWTATAAESKARSFPPADGWATRVWRHAWRARSRARCCSTPPAAAVTAPMPRSTRSSPSAWCCRRRQTTSRRRGASPPRKVSLCCRAAAARRNAGRRLARLSSSIVPSISTKCLSWTRPAAGSRCAPALCLISSIATSSRTACSSPSIHRRPAVPPSAAWPATIPAARAPSATATWCTTCWPSTP